MTTALVGLGAGGHAKVVIEALRGDGTFEFVGLLDANVTLWGSAILGVPVLGNDDLLPDLVRRGVRHFFVGVGSVGDTALRRRLFERGLQAGLTPVTVVHCRAIVSPSAEIGPGAAVLAGAVVNAEARLGANVIVNTGAIVEHDCTVGDHAHVASGARLVGGVRVGAGVHVGAGATVRQGVAIGEAAVIGAGAVVVRDIPPGIVVVGVPARPLRRTPAGVRGQEWKER